VYPRVLWTGVVVAGVCLAWSLGCQTQAPNTNPGALPSGLKTDATPRLNASTYFAHGHLLERQGSFELAVEQYRHALELAPNMVSARNRLGIALNKLGHHAAASREFRAALQRAPGEAYLYNNLGFSLYLEEQHEEAAQALQRAAELKPDFKRARMNLGLALARLGRFDDALAEFTLATSEADAHYNLAVIYTETGRLAEAARALETALRLNPSFEAAREQLRVVAHLAAEEETNAPPQATVAEATPESLSDTTHANVPVPPFSTRKKLATPEDASLAALVGLRAAGGFADHAELAVDPQPAASAPRPLSAPCGFQPRPSMPRPSAAADMNADIDWEALNVD